MPWDRKRFLGYVETIQLILGVTDKALLLFNKDIPMVRIYTWQKTHFKELIKSQEDHMW